MCYGVLKYYGTLQDIVLGVMYTNLYVIETGQKRNLSLAENVYSSEDVEFRVSKLQVPVRKGTCL
jgi:hypothetical protein